MIRWFRVRLRPVAVTVLAALVSLAGLSASPHEIECDDLATATTHDPSGHAIGAVRTSDDPLHCVLCHWIRAFSADGVRAPRPIATVHSSVALVTRPAETTRAVARLNLAPRAPPV